MTDNNTTSFDMDSYARSLYLSNFLRDPIIREAIETLSLVPGSRGLDVGCGIGSHTLKLAEVVAPDGHVSGLDLSPDMIAYAREAAARSSVSSNVSFRVGDMRDIPYPDDTFDWCWSVDCVGYAPLEPLPVINELKRVVKPGGLVSIMAWSSEQLLPGYPQLEAQLRATRAGILPFFLGKPPSSHFLRSLGWFQKVGLQDLLARTFVGEVQAPLSEQEREALIDLFHMRWQGVQGELAAEHWEQFQRLCDPESQDFILNNDDYYAFFTCTMFRGRVG